MSALAEGGWRRKGLEAGMREWMSDMDSWAIWLVAISSVVEAATDADC